MQNPLSMRRLLFLPAAAASLLTVALAAQQSVDSELIAKSRLFPSITSGAVAIRRDAGGRYVVLTERAGVQMFNAKGQPAGHAPADPSPSAAISFGADLDLDEQGNIYVADRAANAIEVYSPSGTLLRTLHVVGPTSVAVLGSGEVAVASLRSPKLVTVYGEEGQVVREFGEPEQIAGREELNRYAHIGRLSRDSSGRLY
jgi:sugar lactone lactonase YvrE